MRSTPAYLLFLGSLTLSLVALSAPWVDVSGRGGHAGAPAGESQAQVTTARFYAAPQVVAQQSGPGCGGYPGTQFATTEIAQAFRGLQRWGWIGLAIQAVLWTGYLILRPRRPFFNSNLSVMILSAVYATIASIVVARGVGLPLACDPRLTFLVQDVNMIPAGPLASGGSVVFGVAALLVMLWGRQRLDARDTPEERAAEIVELARQLPDEG